MNSPFSNIPSFPISIGKPLLWVIFALFLVGYSIVSAILIYHWRKYGMNNKNIVFAETLFLIVSVVLFGTAFFALTLF